MPPFQNILKLVPEITPGIFFMAKRFAIAVPTKFTAVVTPGWIRLLTGLRKGGKNILAQLGEVWWWLWIICGYHSWYKIRLAVLVSGILFINQSRLLSCPTYFWYKIGVREVSKGVPNCFRYQSTIISTPSGLIHGTKRVITSSRMRCISSVSSVAIL